MNRLPFEVTGPQKAVTLISSTFFSPGASQFSIANLSGVLSPVAYRDVPLGTILSLRGGSPFRFYMKATIGVNVTLTGAVQVVPFSLAGYSVVRSVRQAGTFPNQNHPDIHAVVSLGGTWALIDVTTFDFNTGLGTVTVPAGYSGGEVRIFYLTGAGEVEFRASRPIGSDGVTAKLYGSPLRAVHESDQNNARTAPQFGSLGQRYSLPEAFRLTINVRSNESIEWSERARHDIAIVADSLPIRVTDPARMAATAEVMLRGGTI
jgi:hypothetical protein